MGGLGPKAGKKVQKIEKAGARAEEAHFARPQMSLRAIKTLQGSALQGEVRFLLELQTSLKLHVRELGRLLLLQIFQIKEIAPIRWRFNTSGVNRRRIGGRKSRSPLSDNLLRLVAR